MLLPDVVDNSRASSAETIVWCVVVGEVSINVEGDLAIVACQLDLFSASCLVARRITEWEEHDVVVGEDVESRTLEDVLCETSDDVWTDYFVAVEVARVE